MSATPPPERDVVHRIARQGAALIALSGGVDSAVVAALAFEALGTDAVAVTLTGSAVAADELERARAVARAIGIAHEELSADPIERAEYRANPPDRCYYCRTVETAALRAWGAPRGIAQYLDGVQLDDLSDDRPGLRAMDEAGFLHPLLWGGWGKEAVRAIARRRGLPNWDQPSGACLASRVAHGEPITPELLRKIESAEAVVAAHGFRRVRVRVRQGAARIEVGPEEVDRLSSEPLASELIARLRALGFAPVTIEPRGYSSSSQRLPVVR